MITGRLIEYNDMYYAILNLKHKDAKRLQKRFSLDLSVKNNKRRAEEKLSELCRQHTTLCAMEQNAAGILKGAEKLHSRHVRSPADPPLSDRQPLRRLGAAKRI